MTLRRYKDIVALQTSSGELVGFHTRNLEVAKLDPAVWQAMRDESAEAEARQELEVWNNSQNSEVKDEHLKQEVRGLSINVTQVCNLHCKYCAAGGDGTYGSEKAYIEVEKTIPQIKFFLDKVPAGEKFMITFLGGEPLLYPEAIKIIAEYSRALAKSNGVSIGFKLTTNATLITPQIANQLAEMKCHVRVSLDGPPQSNDEHRPTKGGKDSTERTIRGLRELEKVKSHLSSLATNSIFGIHNTRVMEAYRFLRQFDLDEMLFGFAPSAGDEEASQEFLANMCELAEYAYSTGGERELRRISEFDKYFSLLDSQTRIYNFCGAGKNLLQIDSKNNVYACNWFMNNPHDKLGSGTQIDAEKLSAYREPLTQTQNCQNCWARFLCGGGCMFVHETKTGNKRIKDNQFCQRTRSLIAKGVELYGKARTEEKGV